MSDEQQVVSLGADHRFHDARQREQLGDIAGAIEIYRELLLDDPQDVRVRNNLGCLYEKRGEFQRALEQFEAARAVAPDNVGVLLNVGSALASLSRFEPAEKELRRAQKLDPSRSDVYTQLGIMYFKRGLYANAEVELKRAVELNSENGVAHYYRGESLNHLSRVEEALEALQRAVQQQPGNLRAYQIMGILYDKKGMPQQANEMYRKMREVAGK